MKSFVLAGTGSGVGKTIIATGLMAALTEAGYNVQPFKVGPDYIDPGFHNLVTENKSRNLDSYFLSSTGVREVFFHQARKADISIIEGVMGLFDGKGRQGIGSTAQIAKILQVPVILIIDAKKLAQSGAAMACGYQNYDPDLKVKGVILNKIGSKGHYQLVKTAIEENSSLEVVGYLPFEKGLELPERHLGLVPVQESQKLTEFYSHLVERINTYLDLDKLRELAELPEEQVSGQGEGFFLEEQLARGKNYDFSLAVAYDRAFNFYYQENLDLLQKIGAELKFFSPLDDEKLPPADGVYIGGGFPESFLAELAENSSMKRDIREKIEQGLPVYAECGGLMYLAKDITGSGGQKFKMVGSVPARVVQEDSLQAMGYVEVEATRDSLLLDKGQKARGHEFHYSRLVQQEGNSEYSCYLIDKSRYDSPRPGGFKYKNLLASYVHLYFASNPDLLFNLAEKCTGKDVRK